MGEMAVVFMLKDLEIHIVRLNEGRYVNVLVPAKLDGKHVADVCGDVYRGVSRGLSMGVVHDGSWARQAEGTNEYCEAACMVGRGSKDRQCSGWDFISAIFSWLLHRRQFEGCLDSGEHCLSISESLCVCV